MKSDRRCEARLDLIRNPFGAVSDVIESRAAALPRSMESSPADLRRRISEVYRVSPASIGICDSVDQCLGRIVLGRQGPVVGFPPSATASRLSDMLPSREAIWVLRGVGRRGEVDLESASDLPGSAIAIVDSPTNPLGSLLGAAAAVRLARACQFLVVDERFSEFAGISLLPLTVEFDNIVVLRSFETWAGVQNPPCAWFVASARAASALGIREHAVEPKAVSSALTALDDMATVGVTMRLWREERSRLFRMLRKFSFLEPLPSWGPFVPARVRITSRDALVAALGKRDVHIHVPWTPGLERYVRVGIGSRGAMDHLRSALLDAAPELVG
jgi:histidinol-phosphate aminotransferase